ncbi:hypothetical protein J7L70_02815 [Candidatus Bathyarchaeota archaeon]|nr:hypothetical protein [Candidatus Bathyarchaeota archaeon]
MGRRIKMFSIIAVLALTLATFSSLNAVTCQPPYVEPTGKWLLRPGNSSGVIVFKIYPDDYVGITGTFETSLEGHEENVSIPKMCINITNRPVDGEIKQRANGFIEMPDIPDPKVKETLEKMVLNIVAKGSGDENETMWYANVNLSLPETIEINAELSSYGNAVEKYSDINVTLEAALYYDALNMTKSDVQDIVVAWPILRGFIEAAVIQASDGLIDLSLGLEDYSIGPESATLLFKSRVSGNLIEGLRRFLEKPVTPPSPVAPPTSMPEIPKETREALKAVLSLLENRYAWVEDAEFNMTWNREEKAFVFDGYTVYGGDLGEQYKTAWATVLRIQLMLMAGKGREDVQKLALEVYDLIINSEFDVDKLTISMYVNPDEGCSRFKLSDLKMKPKSIPSFLSVLSLASEVMPSKRLTLVIQGSSDADEMVEVEIPLAAEKYIAEPVSIEGRYRIEWTFERLGAIDRLQLTKKPNTIGIVDFNYVEVKKTVNETEYVVEVFTNSSLVDAPTFVDNKLEMTVSGVEGTLGALNVSIPKALVDGVVVILVNGELVKPKAKLAGECYAVYATYSHSIKKLEIVWTPPDIEITVDKNEVDVGGEVEVSGTFKVLGKPMAGEKVDILLDGVKIAEATTDGEGGFSAKLKLENEGEYIVKAVYDFVDQSFESNEVTVKVILAWYQNPVILGGMAAAIVIAIAVIVILSRRQSF